MDSHMVLYRGSLKSCNYRCSYCPFSKKPLSEKELEKDREQWNTFTGTFRANSRRLGTGALMVVPYGEALIHSWYWEGMAHISMLPWIEAVGAQTNFSFSLEESLGIFEGAGGIREKLRIWATFHPEMTTVAEFAGKCRQLRDRGIALSAGAVGVPKNLGLLQALRRELPKEIYFWLNRMDGLGRPYTEEETEACLTIDPYFLRELMPPVAKESLCKGRLFVEGDGRLRLCNISQALDRCGRRRCTCYLAYGGREEEWNRMLFGTYPLFRIPRRPKAVFLDIQGTLIPDEEGNLMSGKESGNPSVVSKKDRIPAAVSAGLEGLFRDGSLLFFATTLPLEDGIRRCKGIRRFFSGGVFAGGAHIVLEKDGEKKEKVIFLKDSVLQALETLKNIFSCWLLVCKKDGKAYKATLLRSAHKPWKMQEMEEVLLALPDKDRKEVRCFVEGNCLQIVDAGADKAAGVRILCRWLGIVPEETYAIGDSEEDAGMVKLCGKGEGTGEERDGFV